MTEQERLDELRERLAPDISKLPWTQRLRIYAAKDLDWGDNMYTSNLEREVLSLQSELQAVEEQLVTLRRQLLAQGENT